jgi:hypothetical protein
LLKFSLQAQKIHTARKPFLVAGNLTVFEALQFFDIRKVAVSKMQVKDAASGATAHTFANVFIFH